MSPDAQSDALSFRNPKYTAGSDLIIRGKSLLLKENNHRIRYLTEGEITHLLQECLSSKRKHLYRVVVCALNTGMRKGEILDLRWNQIRNGFMYLEKTKTKNRREIPVNEELAAILKEIRKEEGLTSEYVFTYARCAIDRMDRAFRGARSTKVIRLITY